MLRVFTLLFICTLFFSCSSIEESSKYELQSATYYTSLLPTPHNKVYIQVESDTIQVFPVKRSGNTEVVGTVPVQEFTDSASGSFEKVNNYYNPAFDIDFLTIPLKYRFPTAGVPNQLTTNFNGVMYLGFRNDIYRITYKQNPLKEWKRNIRHFGSSLGGFAGLSSEPVNPWVTNEEVEIEYDGAVFSTGLAWIVGINNLSAGLSLGFDHLLDPNRKFWIYQGKPWIGVVLGINLN